SDGQQYKRIAQTRSNVTKYIDLASLDGSVYWYRVSAYNEHGESGFTNIAKVSIAEAIVENVKDVLEDVLDPIVSEVEDTLSEDTKKEVASSELDMTDLSVKSLFNDGTYYAGV